jgi:hypothetical protein
MVSRALALGPNRATALVALLAAAVSTITPPAAAQTGSTVPVDGTVVLHLTGPDDPALRDSIRELLARLHLLVASQAPDVDGGPSAAVARVEIDLSSRTDALLLVTDDAGEVRFRRAVPRDATPAIIREEIAHAVQSAVESALLAARERAARPASPPPPAAPSAVPPPAASSAPPRVAQPPPAAPSTAPLSMPSPSAKEQPVAGARPSAFGLEITTLAGVSPIANGAGPAPRIGLGIAAISSAPLHPSLGLSLLYAVPFDTGAVGTVDLSTHVNIASVRLLPALSLIHGKWLAVDLGAGGGIDVTTVAPRSDSSEYYVPPGALQGEKMRVDPMLSAMLTAHAGLVPGVVFLVSAGVDVDLAQREYVFDQGSSATAVLSPWRVRPMVLAGFGFAALGDGHFSTGGR